ncbi:MAG: type II secretion system F family protein [Armatimonadota bacterium]
MPTFQYTVRDQAGKVTTGVKEADSQAVLARQLREQGFTVAKIKQTRAAAKGAVAGQPAKGTGGGVKLADLSVFCRQFSTMVDAGVSLVRCLNVLQEQATNPKLKRITADIQAEVEAGNSLSKAMSKYPRVFNNLFIGLVRAGEVGGVLEESLQRLAHFLEKDLELRRKVKAAMTYPTIVVFVALAIVLGLCTFIVPKFFDLFKELGLKEDTFPVMTLWLKQFSDFLIMGFPGRQIITLLVVTGLVIGFKMFIRTRFGKRLYDRFKLKAPVFGKLNHKIALARFSRTLSTLLTSGVPILQAMETVAGAVDNEIISDAVMHARARIREGDRIGPPLQKSRLFPPMVVQMISIGEESGALDNMLTKVAEFYEAEVDAALDSLTAAIEPVLIVFLGFCVGFIVIAMFLPMVNLIQGLSGGEGDGDGGGE